MQKRVNRISEGNREKALKQLLQIAVQAGFEFSEQEVDGVSFDSNLENVDLEAVTGGFSVPEGYIGGGGFNSGHPLGNNQTGGITGILDASIELTNSLLGSR